MPALSTKHDIACGCPKAKLVIGFQNYITLALRSSCCTWSGNWKITDPPDLKCKSSMMGVSWKLSMSAFLLSCGRATVQDAFSVSRFVCPSVNLPGREVWKHAVMISCVWVSMGRGRVWMGVVWPFPPSLMILWPRVTCFILSISSQAFKRGGF